MATQALYRKWRSQTFDEVVGQEHISQTLRNAVRDERMSHAYLFTGPRGTGKTSMARILAKAINCLNEDVTQRPCNRCRICTAITEGHQLDLIEIDAASNRGIDEIRDLRDRIGFRPNEARYKVYIIDEVHMLTKEAFNALLKTLEEPPPHAVIVMATTEPDRVPETVRSRCQRFDFRRIPTPEIVDHLSVILRKEGREAEPEALLAIARRATGSMRDAISLLDQLLSYGEELLDLARVEQLLGLVDARAIGALVDSILTRDAAAGLALINRMVADGVEIGEFLDQTVVYLRGVLFVRVTRATNLLDVTQEVGERIAAQAQQADTGLLLDALRAFIEARADLRDQVPGVPQLPIEVALLKVALPESAPVAAPAPAAREVQAPAPVAPAPMADARRAAEPAGPALQPEEMLASREGPPREPAPPVGATPPEGVAQPPDAAFLELVQKSWPRLLEAVGKRCGMKIQAALRSARPVAALDETLVIQFDHAFARDLVNQPENGPQVQAVLEELLARKLTLRLSIRSENVAASPASPQAAPLPAESKEDALLTEARKMGAVIRPLE